jgi:hypothetical protein
MAAETLVVCVSRVASPPNLIAPIIVYLPALTSNAERLLFSHRVPGSFSTVTTH